LNQKKKKTLLSEKAADQEPAGERKIPYKATRFVDP